MKATPIAGIMSEQVVTVDDGQQLSDVWDLLRRHGIHHVPVVNGLRPIGVISATDILRLAYDFDATDDRMMRTMLDHQFSIDDAMSTALVTLPTDATVHDAAELLATGDSHSVLIIDAVGELAGIVTTTDLIRFLRDL